MRPSLPIGLPPAPSPTATRLALPSADAPEGGPLVLAVVLGLLVAVTLEMAVFLLTALGVRILNVTPGTAMRVVLSFGSLVAWALAGAVVYEVARRRRATSVAAALPIVIALGIVGATAVAGGSSSDAELVAGSVSSMVLGCVTYAGGRLWERRIRRRDALQ
jgi:hypothetical protein